MEELHLFELNVREKGDVIKHLLSINNHLIFAEGVMCAIHSGMHTFSIAEHPINLDGVIMNDCTKLSQILKSKTIEKASFFPELGKLEITEPFEYSPQIDIIDNENLVEEAGKRVNILEEIHGTDVFVDKRNEKHSLTSFDIDNDVFRDMLIQVGKGDFIEIRTGDKLQIINHDNKAKIKHREIVSEEELSVLITETAQPFLISSLISTPPTPEEDPNNFQSKSKIYLIDEAFIVLENICTTIINSRVETR